MRRIVTFACEGETLVGTLDAAPGDVGVLIVSGGNEIRIGAHRGMAELAQRLRAAGVPVFRYDRRGIGDSTGENLGFEGSAADIAAAAGAFRANHRLTSIVAFGNCDAASALALFHRDAGIGGLVLANPWTGGEGDALPAAAAVRARYAERLRDPREWLRLLRGGVDLGKLAGGLRKIVATRSEPPPALVGRIAAALAKTSVPAIILLAERDNTAVTFADAWRRLASAPPIPIHHLDSASHSFASRRDKDWLFERLLAAVRA